METASAGGTGEQTVDQPQGVCRSVQRRTGDRCALEHRGTGEMHRNADRTVFWDDESEDR